MASGLIPLKRPYTSEPTQPRPTINQKYLDMGLTGAFIFNEAGHLINIVNGKTATRTGTLDYGIDVKGHYHKWDETTAEYWDIGTSSGSGLNTSGNYITVISGISVDTTMGSTRTILSNWSDNVLLRMTGTELAQLYLNGGTLLQTASSFVSGYNTIAFKNDGATMHAWVNGVKDANTTALSGTLDTSDATSFYIGSSPHSTTNSLGGSLYWLYVFNRPVVDSEIVELQNNPWQLFSYTQHIPVGFGAAPASSIPIFMYHYLNNVGSRL